MKDLHFVRPDFETRGEEPPVTFPDGLRVLRMSFAVSHVIDIPFELYCDAENVYARVDNDMYSDERRYDAAGVAVLAAFVDAVQRSLDDALDGDNFPRGPGGELIKQEAALPSTDASGRIDDDRVFKLDDDGRVNTLYPRMSLWNFRDALAELVAFFRAAASRGLEVAWLE